MTKINNLVMTKTAKKTIPSGSTHTNTSTAHIMEYSCDCFPCSHEVTFPLQIDCYLREKLDTNFKWLYGCLSLKESLKFMSFYSSGLGNE